MYLLKLLLLFFFYFFFQRPKYNALQKILKQLILTSKGDINKLISQAILVQAPHHVSNVYKGNVYNLWPITQTIKTGLKMSCQYYHVVILL